MDGPGGNVHVGAGNPTIGAGEVMVGIAHDFDGFPRTVPPTLGAFTFFDPGDPLRDGLESGDLRAWSAAAP